MDFDETRTQDYARFCKWRENLLVDVKFANAKTAAENGNSGVRRLQPFALVCCQLRFCFVLYFFFFSCIYVIIICFFKAASLDDHMAFLVAVHYVIFLLGLILYASLENKFFFFFFFFFFL